MRALLKSLWTFGALVLVIFLISVHDAAYPPSGCKVHGEANKNGPEEKPECVTFWETTFHDPVAFFTLVLAGSTIALWLATYRMWQATAEAARAARDAAEVTPLLERAYVYVRVEDPGIDVKSILRNVGGKLEEGTEIHRRKTWLAFENHGKTPATLTRLWIRAVVVMSDHSARPPPIDPQVIGGRTLPAGLIATESSSFREGRKWNNVSASDEEILTNKASFWIYGFVRYRDIFDASHITGFALVYDPSGQRFVLTGGRDHNYMRQEDPSQIPQPSPHYGDL